MRPPLVADMLSSYGCAGRRSDTFFRPTKVKGEMGMRKSVLVLTLAVTALLLASGVVLAEVINGDNHAIVNSARHRTHGRNAVSVTYLTVQSLVVCRYCASVILGTEECAAEMRSADDAAHDGHPWAIVLSGKRRRP
jgi:hypothetical protein